MTRGRCRAVVVLSPLIGVSMVVCQAAECATAQAARVQSHSARYDDPAAYCAAVGTIDKPDARYAGPAMPDWVARALRQASGASPDAPLDLFRQGAWRCAGGAVLACTVGANIPCDSKGDTSRVPGAGIVAYCRDNPASDAVPAYATGHATVYQWRCRGGQPEIERQVLTLDVQGYPTAFWYRLSPPAAPKP